MFPCTAGVVVRFADWVDGAVDPPFECSEISIIGLKGVTEVIRTYNMQGAKDVQNYILSLADYFCSKMKNELHSPQTHKMMEVLMMKIKIRAHCF